MNLFAFYIFSDRYLAVANTISKRSAPFGYFLYVQSMEDVHLAVNGLFISSELAACLLALLLALASTWYAWLGM